MATTEERVQRGEEVMQELSAGARRAAGLPEYEIAPDMGKWVTASLFGDVWGRPDLPKKVRSIATMSTLTVMGREPQLRSHVNFALNLGWAKEEIAELFFHLALYGGLPASLNALRVAREVFQQRGLLETKEATTGEIPPTSEERFAKGVEVLKELTGGQSDVSMGKDVELVPGMNDYIVEALFGDVWGRPALPKKIRSIATMSALTALGREPQLKGHIGWALNLGWAKEEIAELFFHLAFYGGLPASLNALRLAREVFQERGLIS
ncbi:MAG: carboxymuconolactone decarboxylase family protein [Dehalococcoidia bacterium]